MSIRQPVSEAALLFFLTLWPPTDSEEAEMSKEWLSNMCDFNWSECRETEILYIPYTVFKNRILCRKANKDEVE